jgi:hypothetical protein
MKNLRILEKCAINQKDRIDIIPQTINYTLLYIE